MQKDVGRGCRAFRSHLRYARVSMLPREPGKLPPPYGKAAWWWGRCYQVYIRFLHNLGGFSATAAFLCPWDMRRILMRLWYTVLCVCAEPPDTHCRHDGLLGSLPPGDVLIHAGDFTSTGATPQVGIHAIDTHVGFGLWGGWGDGNGQARRGRGVKRRAVCCWVGGRWRASGTS